ncbi:MAG: hypothetical protein ACE5MI_06830 [Acidimicrobiia bacterium]
MTSISRWISAVVVVGMLAGCGEPVDVAAFPTVPPGLPPEIYDAIVADLRDQLSGSPLLITVTAESVNWNDASLGCPAPGEFSAQVITPGFRVIFVVDDTTYDYRASQAGDFRLCP